VARAWAGLLLQGWAQAASLLHLQHTQLLRRPLQEEVCEGAWEGQQCGLECTDDLQCDRVGDVPINH
jgi:hypothetical protein